MIKINEIYTDLINVFPTGLDPNRIFRDIDAETKPLADKYYSLINANNFDGASKLKQDNPILQKMIIDAYTIQYLYDMNISTQRFYMNDVQQYLVNIVAYQNTYEKDKKYKKYNVVNYTVAGAKEAYMCIDNEIPIGTLPTDVKYWVALTLRGEKGNSGTGLAWRGKWNSTITYSEDDCVSHNNILWAAKNENINSAPDDVSDDWEYALKIETNKADKSTLQPHTLLASNWQGDKPPYTYKFEDAKITATSNQELLPSETITSKELSALQSANLTDTGQDDGYFILQANGTKPKIDIPIRLIFRGDM